MSVKLLSRINVGEDTPAFSLEWLNRRFVPAQRDRAAKVRTAVESANKRIEAVREEIAQTKRERIGTLLPSGAVYSTADEQQFQRQLGVLADRQTASRVAAIKREVDGVVPLVLREMERAAMGAQTLRERTFDKYSCLSRTTGGLKLDGALATRAHYAVMLAHADGLDLGRMAQRAIDDGSPLSLVLVDALLRENLGRPRDRRGFSNPDLLELVNVPEFNEAGPLLQEVIDLHRTALDIWAGFTRAAASASTIRVASGLRQQQRKEA